MLSFDGVPGLDSESRAHLTQVCREAGIFDEIEEIEKYRKLMYRFSALAVSIGAGLSGLLLWWFSSTTPSGGSDDGGGVLFPIALGGLAAGWFCRKFKKRAKNKIGKKFIQAILPGSNYDTAGAHTASRVPDYTASGIIRDDNESSFEDSFLFQLPQPADIELCAGEYEFWHYSGSGKNRRKVTTGRGMLYDITFQNPRFTINAPVLALAKGVSLRGHSDWEKVEVENVDFSDQYTIYSPDPIEARRVFTPAFMQRLLSFLEHGNGYVYEVFFHNNRVYIDHDYLRSRKGFSIRNNFIKSGSVNKFEFSFLYSAFVKCPKDLAAIYVEIQLMLTLAKDLNLYYYDQDAFSSVRT